MVFQAFGATATGFKGIPVIVALAVPMLLLVVLPAAIGAMDLVINVFHAILSFTPPENVSAQVVLWFVSENERTAVVLQMLVRSVSVFAMLGYGARLLSGMIVRVSKLYFTYSVQNSSKNGKKNLSPSQF